jgi:membrane protease YdiL (CAAX protease family)
MTITGSILRIVLYLLLVPLVAGVLVRVVCVACKPAIQLLVFQATMGAFALVFAVLLLLQIKAYVPNLLRRPSWRETLALAGWDFATARSMGLGVSVLLPASKGNLEAEYTGSGLAFGVSLFAVGLAVPLLEEVLFRGWLLRSYGRAVSYVWAVPISALVFGLAHQEPTVVVFAFVSGLVLGRYMAAGGSLWATFISHAIGNSTALVLAFGAQRWWASRSEDNSAVEPFVAWLALVLSSGLLWLFFQRNPIRRHGGVNPAPEMPWLLFAAIVLLGVGCVVQLEEVFRESFK